MMPIDKKYLIKFVKSYNFAAVKYAWSTTTKLYTYLYTYI